MSRFKYSDEEMDVNKVLKMNQYNSETLSENQELKRVRKAADNSIDSSVKLLRSIGKDEEILKLSEEITGKNDNRPLMHKPQLESWKDIAARAGTDYNYDSVVLEDIMTASEIWNSLAELDDINKQFSKKTSIINKTDLSFLAIAVALQVTKTLIFPYIAEKFNYGRKVNLADRLEHNDKSIESAHRNANDKFRDEYLEKHAAGHWINILYQTVPYDITKGSRELGMNMGGRYHRMYTLGHDPILGWIFGTANILTDCITFNNFHTNRIVRADPITGTQKMSITSETVRMEQMFSECYHEVKADFLNLPAALFAQAQHLKSDEFTKMGLPVPVLSSFNEKFASKLYSENYDALCFARDIRIVGISFVVSKLFDMIISLTHGMLKKEDEDRNLYEIRTRKILLVSNSIASTSAIIHTAITKNPKNLDIGSLLNTVTHLFSDIRFMSRIKEEFIENEISNRLMKEIREIDDLYENI